MNKTIFTKHDVEKLYDPNLDLGSLMKAFEEEFLKKGEVICQFKLNGMTLSEEDEVRLSKVNLEEIQTIEIESENPTSLLFGLLDNWIQELPLLIKNVDELSKEIKFEGIEGHLKSFVDLIDSCQFLMESLIHLKNIVRTDLIPEKMWAENESLTARAIGEALTCFEKKDFVQLSEILEYDLGHSLQNWYEQLIIVRNLLQEESAQDGKKFEERIFNKKGTEAKNPMD